MRKRPVYLTFITTAILCICNAAVAQKLAKLANTGGLYYKTLAQLKNQQSLQLGFYTFTPGDTIASIGAQNCNWEASFAAVSDSLFFYLQDIDSTYCNSRLAARAWQYYSTLTGAPLTSHYAIVTGDEKTTHLPLASCNKILIINSFHEFTYPAEMLADISTRLKPGGILFIDEAMAYHTGELHAGCKKRMYMENELIEILLKTGFTLKNSQPIAFRKNNLSRKIFAFTYAGKQPPM